MMEEIVGITLLNIVYYVVVVTLILLLLSLFYWLFFVPWNYVKNVSDVGYNHLKEECKKRGLKMKDMVSHHNKLRKRGNLPPIYPNGWIPLLSSKQLEIEKVKSVCASGETFAVFRDSKGKVHILDAYCPHLGANLAIGGRVVDNCIQCPFHSWEFRGNDGKCTKIPYATKVPEFISIKAWKSFEVNDFIFVWYHAEGEEPTWFPPEIPQITSGEWVLQGSNETHIASHIQDIIENSADIQHFTTLHEPNILNGTDLLNGMLGRVFQFLKHRWQVSWQKPDESQKHIAAINLQHRVELFGKKSLLNIKLAIRMFGPAVIHVKMSTTKEIADYIHYITPISPTETLVLGQFFTSVIGPIAKLIMLGAKINFERDVLIWNNKMHSNPPMLVKEDKYISEFRHWFSQFYSKNSPRVDFSRKKISIDW